MGKKHTPAPTSQFKITPPDTFHRDYEFKYPHRVRSPLKSQWEADYFADIQDHGHFYYDPKEVAFVNGHAHGYKGTSPKGRLRVSGMKGAHQIGKRK